MEEEWLYGRDWCGTVILDGQDVSSDCLAVLMKGERPVRVLLGVRVYGKLICRPRHDGALTETREGDIHLGHVRRRTEEERTLLDGWRPRRW